MSNQNLEMALDTLKFLHPDGGVFEICIIAPLAPTSPNWTGKAFGKKPIVAGWFRNQEKAANRQRGGGHLYNAKPLPGCLTRQG
jgi:hypothetical protein